VSESRDDKVYGFETAKEVLDYVRREGNRIRFVNILFPDIIGDVRGFSLPTSELEEALERGKGFDGSSIEGLVRIYESDLVARPDPRTFRIWPWEFGNGGASFRVGVMLCDLLNPDGSPNEGDTRGVLKRTLEEAREMGYSAFYCGPELEYFYFPVKNGRPVPEPLDRGNYFSMGGNDPYAWLRMDTQLELNRLGIHTNYDHHEVAPSQHEIDLVHLSAVEMADAAMLHRYLVKEMARRHGLYATFMPKPLNGQNGSGMHTHQSLEKVVDGCKTNAFFSKDGKNFFLSDDAWSFMAGLLEHINDILLLCCQWVNSYKRLVPGFEAPVYHSIGVRNRSALIRIPEYEPGVEKATRFEIRCLDPACNFYLAFAAMLKAGLNGIRRKLPRPPVTVDESVYELDEMEIQKRKLKTLPTSLRQAMELSGKSKLVKDLLGDHLLGSLLDNKKVELDNYEAYFEKEPALNRAQFDTQVSPYEIEHYLPRL
jgi:glutamine synthetase